LPCPAARRSRRRVGISRRPVPTTGSIRVGEVASSSRTSTVQADARVFVAAKDRLEVAKVEKGDRRGWVWAHRLTFTADRLEASVINLDGSIEERAVFAVNRAKGVVDVSVGDRKGSAAWRQVPFHVYNFDFTSLNFAWRHLIDPKAPFTIGVIDPTFQKDGPLVFYRGDADRLHGRGRLHGKTCRSYRISGEGIGGDRHHLVTPAAGSPKNGPLPGQPRLEPSG
jgi:hypothetical protein